MDSLDPGRKLRDEEVELIFRNNSMLSYIFNSNLYNKEGLGARYRAVNASVAQSAPYLQLEVRFPNSASMVSAD